MRISSSMKAHRIRIRQADFESLAEDLTTRKFFTSEACRYGQNMEPQARQAYERYFSCTVIRMGLVVCKPQPWLCCSLDGFIREGRRLLEIKCPYTCRDRPICSGTGDPHVKYIECTDGMLRLKTSHPYYTQVQVCMYVVNVNQCDFFVYSPAGHVCITVTKDDSLLQELIPKMEAFYFNSYLPMLCN